MAGNDESELFGFLDEDKPLAPSAGLARRTLFTAIGLFALLVAAAALIAGLLITDKRADMERELERRLQILAEGRAQVLAEWLQGSSQLAGRIAEAQAAIMAGVRAEAARFVWDDYGSPEGLERTRLSAMKFFLEDYEEGRAEGRYLDAGLPEVLANRLALGV